MAWPCPCCHNGVNLWTPERIAAHLKAGKILPNNWQDILETAGLTPTGQLTLH